MLHRSLPGRSGYPCKLWNTLHSALHRCAAPHKRPGSRLLRHCNGFHMPHNGPHRISWCRCIPLHSRSGPGDNKSYHIGRMCLDIAGRRPCCRLRWQHRHSHKSHNAPGWSVYPRTAPRRGLVRPDTRTCLPDRPALRRTPSNTLRSADGWSVDPRTGSHKSSVRWDTDWCTCPLCKSLPAGRPVHNCRNVCHRFADPHTPVHTR